VAACGRREAAARGRGRLRPEPWRQDGTSSGRGGNRTTGAMRAAVAGVYRGRGVKLPRDMGRRIGAIRNCDEKTDTKPNPKNSKKENKKRRWLTFEAPGGECHSSNGWARRRKNIAVSGVTSTRRSIGQGTMIEPDRVNGETGECDCRHRALIEAGYEGGHDGDRRRRIFSVPPRAGRVQRTTIFFFWRAGMQALASPGPIQGKP